MNWRRPEIPLFLLAAYLPFSRRVSEPNELPSLLVTGILAALALIAHIGRQRSCGQPVARWTPLAWAITGFAGLAVVSLFRAGVVYGGWYLPSRTMELIGWLMPVTLFFLTFWVVQDGPTLKRLVAFLMVMVTLVALLAIREYMSDAGDSFEGSRVGGIADDPNRLGGFFVSYLFLFLGFFLMFPRRRLGWFMGIPLLLCARGVMVTFSRGAYVATVAGGLVSSWFRYKPLFFLAIGLGGLVIAHPAFLPEGIRYRMEMTFVKDSDASASPSGGGGNVAQLLEASAAGRLDIWKAAVQMIQDHPGWGVGFGAFPGFLLDYTRGQMAFDNAHNAFLMIAAEMGIVTAVLFLLILLGIGFHSAWLFRFSKDRSFRAIGLGMLGGLTGFIVANLFSYCFGTQEVSGYFWMLSGLSARAVLIEKASA